jgi:hypothetical protein
VPAGFTATPSTKVFPSITVVTTMLVAVSITETMPAPLLVMAAIYTLVPAEFTATPRGLPAIGTVVTTVLVEVSITDTLLLSEFEMYARTAHGLPVGVSVDVVPPTSFQPLLC